MRCCEPRLNLTLTLLIAAVSLVGCTAAVSSYRDNPNFERRVRRINSIVVLPTRARVYQLDAGGVKEEILEWSEQAALHLNAAVQKEFQERSKTALKLLSEDDLSEAEKTTLHDTRALLEAVETSVIIHTYGPQGYRFPDKILDFDYSIGREVRTLGGGQGDAFLIIQATDHQWTEGRKVLQTLGVIVGVGAAVATGVMVIPVLGGGTMVNAALVDAQTGTLWWYNIALAGTGYDLRDRDSATTLIKELFKDYPSAGTGAEAPVIGSPEKSPP